MSFMEMKTSASSTAANTNPVVSKTVNPRVYDYARALLDKNAENVRILDLSHVSSLADYFLICSGRSTKQVQAICDSLKDSLNGTERVRYEGYSEGRWVICDLGDVIAHVFLDELRDYYDLESLWSDAKRIPIPAEYLGSGASLA